MQHQRLSSWLAPGLNRNSSSLLFQKSAFTNLSLQFFFVFCPLKTLLKFLKMWGASNALWVRLSVLLLYLITIIIMVSSQSGATPRNVIFPRSSKVKLYHNNFPKHLEITLHQHRIESSSVSTHTAPAPGLTGAHQSVLDAVLIS